MSKPMNKGVQRRILLKAAAMSGMSDCVTWTDEGLNELSKYDYEAAHNEEGGPIGFIASALASTHGKVALYEEV